MTKEQVEVDSLKGSAGAVQGNEQASEPAVFVPYQVRVKVPDLKIRKDASIIIRSVGYTGEGIFTIMEEKTGKVNKDGEVGLWGRLGERPGWICLAFADYTERV